MGEKIVVVNSNVICDTYGLNSKEIIQVCEKDILQLINKEYILMERDIVEKNAAFKQIISYCLITYQDEIFMTRRTKKQTESRLHNMYSVGVGGHIGASDVKNEDVVVNGMLRELYEEVFIPSDIKYHFLGIINDNSLEVNTVHMGLCYVINLSDRDCSIRETEKLEGQWVQIKDIYKYMPEMETWSEILLNSYLKTVGAN